MENELLDGSYEPAQGNKTSGLLAHILIYSSILLALLLAYWGFSLYAFRYLEPGITTIAAGSAGLFVIAALFVILLVSIRRYYKNNASSSIFLLTMMGTAISFVALTSYQLIRLPFFNFNISNAIILASIYLVIFNTVLSFFIAFQLKTKRTAMLILMIVALVVLIGTLSQQFPDFGLRR